MLGRVEAPGVLGEGQLVDQLGDQLPLRIDGEVAPKRVVRRDAVRGGLGDQRDEPLPEADEDRAHPLGAHFRLVFVEQRVIRMREPGEALVAGDVAIGELDVPLEVGEEHLEVRGALRLHPDALGEGARPCELRPELGRDPAGLLPIPGDDAGEVGGDRCARLRVTLGTGAHLVHQPADLVPDEHLVADPGERRERLGPRASAPAAGIIVALVPGEQRGGSAQIVDLAETLAKLFQRAHARKLAGRPPRPPMARGGPPRRRRRALQPALVEAHHQRPEEPASPP